MRILRRLGCLLFMANSPLLLGCAASKRSDDTVPKTFLQDVDSSARVERLPFDHAWIKPETKWNKFTGIFIKPVRADLLDGESWSKSRSIFITSREDFIKEAEDLSSYFHAKLVTELKERNGAGLSEVQPNAGAGILTFEIALTELQFSHPVTRAGSLAIPVPASGEILGAFSDPYVSFAARLTDGSTGELLATVADRKFAPRRLIDFNKLTVTSSNREICGLLAEEIADALAGDALTEVSESKWKLLPW